MFDQFAVFIFQALTIVTILFIVIGLPLGETLFTKKK